MENRKFWNVLIVDDEPDIHEVTSLALKREKVFGAKLKLHHARSAREAMDFWQFEEAAQALAVAFIDVVMETETAGLDLCKWIRETRHEHVTQLIIRTGQPGKAPPRQIIDDYNISGYLTKTEATGDRMYMTLKTAIQQYYNLQYLFWSAELYDAARQHCPSPGSLLAHVDAVSSAPTPESFGLSYHRGMDFWDQHYVGQGELRDKDEFLKVAADLARRGGEGLAVNGIAVVDEYVMVQANVVGTPRLATMVVKNVKCPRNMRALYASVWRQNLAYLAEVFTRIG